MAIEFVAGMAVSTLMQLSGYSLKDLPSVIKTLNGQIKKWHDDKKWNKHIHDKARFVTPRAVCEILSEYYGVEDSKSGLKRYSVLINEEELPTTIYTESRYLSLNCLPRDIPMTFVQSSKTTLPQYPAKVEKDLRKYGFEIAVRFDKQKVRLWDGSTYWLLSHSRNEKLHLNFSKTGFTSSCTFNAGLLPHELSDKLIDNNGDIPKLLSRRERALPFRTALLPDIPSLVDFKSRLCIGGVGIVLALARKDENDFIIPLQVRSSKVSDGQGLYSVIPKATHQPDVGDAEDVNVYWTIFRELYEELFEGKKAETPSGHFASGWYFDECPGVGYFRDHEDNFSLEVVGYGINAAGGNYELAILLAVQDTCYWNTYKSKIREMWETEDHILLSTKNEDDIARVLTRGDWASESVFHLVEGLLRLKEIEPERVRLPTLERVLGKR